MAGNARQGTPVRNTNTMPLKIRRGSVLLRPANCTWRSFLRGFGSSGSSFRHSSSDTQGSAMEVPPSLGRTHTYALRHQPPTTVTTLTESGLIFPRALSVPRTAPARASAATRPRAPGGCCPAGPCRAGSRGAAGPTRRCRGRCPRRRRAPRARTSRTSAPRRRPGRAPRPRAP
ncbi:hypothetical protein STIAU_7701 [Stigmatella aurantiaca DW4/3-1]|uniref:Uncharacterized protein n=1 Tax=Stigmatella aurantiaca (strain DW4/3-1) TaxID=378806 RepID=Q098U2_STIAD|nr:hypothetical protein STIAU_7701 [Stigmatella aurantiaca DW4/3-1]